MDEFRFIADASSEENLEAFFAHMAGVDQQLADLLRSKLTELLPLPGQGTARNEKRRTINVAIAEQLEDLTLDLGDEQ